MPDDVWIVEGLVKALDRDDFNAAARFLSDSCVYDSPEGPVIGRDAIINAYRAASAWVHATFDEVAYESEIERGDASDPKVFAVTYIDHIRKGELWYTRRCRQICEVDSQSGKVVTIAYQIIEGETERSDAFFAACGVTRPTRDHVSTPTAD